MSIKTLIFWAKIFSLFYGNIKGKTNFEKDSRIKIQIVKKENNIKYRVFNIKNGRLYTDRIHDAAAILDNKIIDEPSFQYRYTRSFYPKIWKN